MAVAFLHLFASNFIETHEFSKLVVPTLFHQAQAIFVPALSTRDITIFEEALNVGPSDSLNLLM